MTAPARSSRPGEGTDRGARGSTATGQVSVLECSFRRSDPALSQRGHTAHCAAQTDDVSRRASIAPRLAARGPRMAAGPRPRWIIRRRLARADERASRSRGRAEVRTGHADRTNARAMPLRRSSETWPESGPRWASSRAVRGRSVDPLPRRRSPDTRSSHSSWRCFTGHVTLVDCRRFRGSFRGRNPASAGENPCAIAAIVLVRIRRTFLAYRLPALERWGRKIVSSGDAHPTQRCALRPRFEPGGSSPRGMRPESRS